MSGQVITARTGINTQLTISLILLVSAAQAAPEPPFRLPAIAGLDSSPAIRLASELYTEGNMTACETECRRVLLAEPGNGPAALLRAMAASRSGASSTNDLAGLCGDRELAGDIRTIARCELADALLRAGKVGAAFREYRQVFQSTRSHALLRRCGPALTLLTRDDPSLAAGAPELVAQLATGAEIWERRHAKTARTERPRRRSRVAMPIAWIIALYRSQVSPAIGDRCSLTPSCSEFALRALRKHGLVGLAIYADRAVREPDVVKARKNPVYTDGRRRYPDPLEDHDSWMER